ncbi:MAG TPA: hypothetical protein VE476_16250 [Propionibacteriaceae bacterium]|jgi:hypothetical protein|nr:hypothetical protein [Propionibacteriaceae bacterium]
MSVRLEVATQVRAPVTRVWKELVDWSGQSRWIPFTTVRITTAHAEGLGVQASALSGFWLGRLPVGLLDRFVVTGWTPPTPTEDGSGHAELEVLHLGPYFTGVGVFALDGQQTGTRVSCVELFDLPGGRLLDSPGRLLLPLLRGGFRLSLRRFAAVCQS